MSASSRLKEVIRHYRGPADEVWYPFGANPCFDFSLHTGWFVRLIRVRYPKTHLKTIREVEKKYEKDIAAFRTFGVSMMVTKDLVLKEPGPVWRRFMVWSDCIEEVQHEAG